jgi:hypothetical protein
MRTPISPRSDLEEEIERYQLTCYDRSHKMGTVVPHGGSSCGNCRFASVQEDGPHCLNARWVNHPKSMGGGGGESRLPVDDPTNYCCDLWARAS